MRLQEQKEYLYNILEFTKWDKLTLSEKSGLSRNLIDRLFQGKSRLKDSDWFKIQYAVKQFAKTKRRGK